MTGADDTFPMIYTDQPSGLTFIWTGPKKTSIEVTREEVHVAPPESVFDLGAEQTSYITDQSIGVYDRETCTITLEPTREAFLGKVAEWLADQTEWDDG